MADSDSGRRRPDRRIARLALVALLGVLATITWSWARSAPDPRLAETILTPPPSGVPQVVPMFSHVYTIVLENRSASTVLTSADTPYLNQLAAGFGIAEAYQGVAHPSQPNYLALFSGSTQGVTDNEPHDLIAPTIADQLEAAGRSWRIFAEDVPPDCFTGQTASGGTDGAGTYARKHEPAINFSSISGSPRRCANIRPMTDFDPAAADYSFIVPNLCNDAHDCPMSTADGWLAKVVPGILASPSWQDGGVLFITFDEADGPERQANRVATLVIAPSIVAGTRSSVPHSHYSLLRTIQEGFGLPCLALSCQANTLGEFFH